MSLPSTPETLAGRRPSVAQRPYGADIDLDADDQDGSFGFNRPGMSQSPGSADTLNNPFASPPTSAGLMRQGSVAPQLRASQACAAHKKIPPLLTPLAG
jgi:hypothetical protein